MENASKALLIAGAILLVIAIIAIGIGIVSKTRNSIDVGNNQVNSMAVQIHNKKFENMCKEDIDWKEMKSIYSELLAYDANLSTNSDYYVRVSMKSADEKGKIVGSCHGNSTPNDAKNCGVLGLGDKKRIYKIEADYNEKGIINRLNIIYANYYLYNNYNLD